MLELSPVRLAGSSASSVVLIVGPSLGTAATTLWERAAAQCAGVEVLAWDLPGHGDAPSADGPFDIADVADEVGAVAQQRALGRPVHYAGVSLGGAVGLELAVRRGIVRSVVSLCSAPRIGQAEAWRDRAGLVRREGTEAVVEGSRQRWFAAGFVDREPEVANVLLDGLRGTDATSYAWACEALQRFDLRERIRTPAVPLLAVTGDQDGVVPTEQTRAELPAAEHVELRHCGHLPPAEHPAAVADLLIDWLAREGMQHD